MEKQAVSRRSFLKTAAAAFASCTVGGLPQAMAGGIPKQTKPNIILILADDMGYGDASCYGGRHVHTPHLDALAAGGMKFTDFHSNGPVCTPTRAALLTGKYQQRVGMVDVDRSRFYTQVKTMPHKEVTFAEVLKNAGYRTALFGKWHLGDHKPFLPPMQGFDVYYGPPFSNDMTPVWSNNFRPPLPIIDQTDIVELTPDQEYLTERYTDHTIDFIAENHSRPFMVYLPHSMPHRPVFASEPFRREFSKEQMDSIVEGDKKSRDFLYPAAIEEIDYNVGRIRKALRKYGIENNTLIIFTSDNGPASGSAGPFKGGKGSLYEGGHRVPGIFYWPNGIKAGSQTGEIALTMDLLPTFAKLTGGFIPNLDQIDGISLVDLLTRGRKLPERTLFFRIKERKAVRRGPWKLHVTDKKNGQTVMELYHLDNDPGETTDIKDQQPALVKDMAQMLRAWEKKVDTENPLSAEW